jgi:pyruvyltransferase
MKFFTRWTPQSKGQEDEHGSGFRPYRYPQVKIFFWSPQNCLNFGDYLASAVVSRMLAAREILADEPVDEPATLLSIGSVLHFAKDGDIVWGSGRNGKISDDRHAFSRLDVRATRGPLTRRFLLDRGIAVPKVYGDPALLLPHLFPTRFRRAPTPGKIGIVPNLNDLSVIDRGDIIDPTRRWDLVIDEILSCEMIVASSLHGLIVADAFGIPAAHVRFSDVEPDFKYIDYYEGAGRSNFWSSNSIEEAMSRGPLPPLSFDSEALLSAFPYDLWSRESSTVA